MYGYRKDLKERLFHDNYMAFYWMYYRFYNDFETPKNEAERVQLEKIVQDYDGHSLRTLRAGSIALFSYIHNLFMTEHLEQKKLLTEKNASIWQQIN